LFNRITGPTSSSSCDFSVTFSSISTIFTITMFDTLVISAFAG
jgi:hypothetical protein